MNPVLWEPSQERREASLLWKFMQSAPAKLETYADVHRWSLEQMEAFWAHFWDFSGVRASCGYDTVLAEPAMPGARWFTGARLNYAENLLAGDADRLAVIGCAEGRDDERLTRGELRQRVARAQAGLRALGLRKGTRVAAFVPNCVETLVLMLATTASGGVWTSCSPDFGAQGVVDRFGQVQPQLLIVADGYHYNGKRFALDAKVNGVLEQIPGIEQVIRIPFSGAKGELAHGSVVEYPDLLDNAAAEPEFVPVEFDHPLCIMYSSGTTGPPKSIVHGAGGTLLQHLKEQQLQCDLQPGQRLFWFTTCGWMMWNWLVSALASRATIVLYDGSPGHPDLGALWRLAERTGTTHFGTSPKFLSACAGAGLVPRNATDLRQLRMLLSTGAPLVEEQFDWVYRDVHDDLQLASISGGTDIVGCFLGGNPLDPVRRGELQCAQLGMDVQAWSPNGERLTGECGELVCTRPFPSMPTGFWNDADGTKYRAAYFEEFPGVWTHGDFVEMTAEGGAIIYGRSDTTLNPGGVRIGTAEIYRAVENRPEVADAIVVGRPVAGDVEVVLCVKLAEGIAFSDALATEIRKAIRSATTPRHVPHHVVPVAEIPYTISGKKVEKAVLAAITGRPVKNRDALANPESLAEYAALSFD
ncbi:MAG: acetoacetate--CoA ligase [Euryarchaeota archaeon]|nr:acetoacetate--CoA ligase [Euryarchaeota archaeon]MDP6364129.1 acetoacetate--CoA ligase [Candidatus Poseidoniia archaeon]MDP6658476.1 acetoacetate--CoA ligase [Candidatus Poseidoniia archaeon]MDP6846416.1 acetoacetate--CoA ligase [Candidatus Poseidoniia archaeon]MDP7007519.1 acetoacetate--CoA ligase [Candidatus Poseidoniia archaeon]